MPLVVITYVTCDYYIFTKCNPDKYKVDSVIRFLCKKKKKIALNEKNLDSHLLTSDSVFLCDSTCLHSHNRTGNNLRKFKNDIFDFPPYSPELTPYDFNLFVIGTFPGKRVL